MDHDDDDDFIPEAGNGNGNGEQRTLSSIVNWKDSSRWVRALGPLEIWRCSRLSVLDYSGW